ncbi:Holliday junction branch migration protein RuvA [Ruminococcaceae bacterium OttesenSCG-928-A16]|nr:Holliday junction branch migration protein RuvA [Ruminococcaceae bacterium OttesenSCG-928-A16]
MIYSLTGILVEKTPGEAVIECGGIGYLVSIPATASGALPAVGERATLYTYMNVSENDVSLFGFANKEGRDMFRMLTTVSGVGPKVGVAILSALSPEKIVLAISTGDHKTLTAANGVGPKLAQRLVLELKDKVAKGITAGGLSIDDMAGGGAQPAGGASQAVAALVSLGYTGTEAATAVAKVDQTLPVPEIIRIALQGIGGGR